jgi:hypothetical protein
MVTDGGESHKDRAMDYIRSLGGLAQLREFTAVGVPSVIPRRLYADGKLSSPARGVYILPELSDDPFLDYAVEATSAPTTACICLLTAAYLQNLVQRDPRELWIAVPPGTWPPKSVGRLPVRSFQWTSISPEGLVERPVGGYQPTAHMEMAGRRFTMTSIAKTVVDLFAYRGAVGMETAMEALGTAMEGDSVSAVEIEAFASQSGIGPLLEPILSGYGAKMNRRF